MIQIFLYFLIYQITLVYTDTLLQQIRPFHNDKIHTDKNQVQNPYAIKKKIFEIPKSIKDMLNRDYAAQSKQRFKLASSQSISSSENSTEEFFPISSDTSSYASGSQIE